MDWLFLTFISTLSRSIYGVMTKVLSNKMKVSVYTQAMLLPLAGALISVLVSPFIGGLSTDFRNVSVIALLLVILGQGLGNILYFSAIKNLTSGTAQIAFSSVLLFNTVLALLFLDLRLTPVNFAGLFLLMIAILSVVTGKVELHRKGALLMVLSAFMFAVFQLASSEVSKQVGAPMYLLTAYLGAAAVVFAFKARLVIKDLLSAPKAVTVGVPILTALPSVGNFLFAYYAYRAAPEPAKVAMLLTSQVVLTVFLSYIFLNERGNLLRKVVAAILVVVSAVLIKG